MSMYVDSMMAQLFDAPLHPSAKRNFSQSFNYLFIRHFGQSRWGKRPLNKLLLKQQEEAVLRPIQDYSELNNISKFSHSSTLLTKFLTLGRNDNIHMFLRAHLCKVQIGSCVLNKELQFMTSTLEGGGGHWQADKVREVAWMWTSGSKNWTFLQMSYMETPYVYAAPAVMSHSHRL